MNDLADANNLAYRMRFDSVYAVVRPAIPPPMISTRCLGFVIRFEVCSDRFAAPQASGCDESYLRSFI